MCERGYRSFSELSVDGTTRCFPLHCMRLFESGQSPWTRRRRHGVRGVPCRSEIGYTGPKTFHINASQDDEATRTIINTCLAQTVEGDRKCYARPSACLMKTPEGSSSAVHELQQMPVAFDGASVECGLTKAFVSACLRVFGGPDDRVARKEFAVTMLEKLDEDSEFLRKIMISDARWCV